VFRTHPIAAAAEARLHRNTWRSRQSSRSRRSQTIPPQQARRDGAQHRPGYSVDTLPPCTMAHGSKALHRLFCAPGRNPGPVSSRTSAVEVSMQAQSAAPVQSPPGSRMATDPQPQPHTHAPAST
jgi:hypothetical protein